MTLNVKVRQLHHWVSALLSVIVAGIFLTLAIGKEPAAWVYYLPLLPLAFLMLSGIYLFILPYTARRSRGRLGA